MEYIVADPTEDAKDRSDPRVGGWFAAFCRRHSIDELPQLWHVFRGEMSLVGPRPLTRIEVHRYYEDSASGTTLGEAWPDRALASLRAKRDQISATGGDGFAAGANAESETLYPGSSTNDTGGYPRQRGLVGGGRFIG